jgi:hypothetical protein
VALIAGSFVVPSSDGDDDGGQNEAQNWETHGNSEGETKTEM